MGRIKALILVFVALAVSSCSLIRNIPPEKIGQYPNLMALYESAFNRPEVLSWLMVRDKQNPTTNFSLLSASDGRKDEAIRRHLHYLTRFYCESRGGQLDENVNQVLRDSKFGLPPKDVGEREGKMQCVKDGLNVFTITYHKYAGMNVTVLE